ncbi:MAG: hypothetical protein MJD61_01830, partial [Proteobacteria bacterium]|nr:hypothetical protein [Pseudomonadota bacterium]
EVSCGMVSEAVDGVVASALAGPSQLLVSIPPPKCYVEAEAVQECVEKCDLQFVPMDTVQCGLGEAMGGCAGACVGLCHFRNPVACPGAECRGTCKGTCAGVCDGTCSEQCPNQHPKCLDQCSGICEGRCVGECTGTCSGTCVSINMTTCSGACEGTCSTELIEPSCAGQASIHADADCKAACEASVRARSAVCTEPNASVTLVGKTLMGPAPSPTPNQNPNPSAMGGSPDPMTGPTGEEMLAKLMGTLHRNWPAFVATQLNLREVQHVGTAYLNSAMAASAGFQGFPDAQQCLSEALTDMDDTLIVIGITLTVSNQLQASVQAAAAP